MHAPQAFLSLLAGLLGPIAPIGGVLQNAGPTIAQTPLPPGDGWAGFRDVPFLLDTCLTLALAAVLAAAISYHPKRIRTADTLEEIEAPKVAIGYAVIGALIGLIVVHTDLLVGFVIFGIGALFRFRTVMRSAQMTGQVILATLVGLACGLDLPHIAVLAAAFDTILTFLLQARMTYRIDVQGLPEARFTEAVDAYRAVLLEHDLLVRSEKKNPLQGRVRFVFRSASSTRATIDQLLDDRVDPALKGAIDWEVD